jgi:hypothetical protein
LGGTFVALGVDRAVGTASATLGGSFIGVGTKSVKGVILTSFGGTFTASGTSLVIVVEPLPVTYREGGRHTGAYRDDEGGAVYREKGSVP